MLATFIIGLREGLEAALVVSIIATFLRRNGSSLVPLIIGVSTAVLLSIGVGFALWLVESSLPQAAQEGMETVIGAMAVCFVTGMVLWMNTHARGMKQELEHAAELALGRGSSRALATMAFLAVLKEGFETAVFLLATFQSTKSTGLAAGGAGLGICCAVLLGYGLYSGGVRINLSRFFNFTAGFLILVAAGLVMTALGTAHEAGWLNAGQQHTVDLGWLSPPGSVRGALITGVLGIPAQPVLIQVLGWFAYLVPMMILLLWPATRRLGPAALLRTRIAVAAGLIVTAVALAVVIKPATLPQLGVARVVSADGTPSGSVRVVDGRAVIEDGSQSTTMALRGGHTGTHLGVGDVVAYRERLDQPAAGLPTKLSLQELVDMSDGRLPVGFVAGQTDGPFRAKWTRNGSRQIWLVDGQVLDYRQIDATAVTLTGGGLPSSRTLAVTGTAPGGIAVGGGAITAAPQRVQAAEVAAGAQTVTQIDRHFWGRTLPVLLAVLALALLLWALYTSRALTRTSLTNRSPRSIDAQ